MARVKYDRREVDHNFKIEEGIRKTFEKSATAEVSASVIQSVYDWVDAEGNPLDGTLEDRCESIAKSVGARFSFAGDNVVFTRSSPQEP